MIRRLVPAMSCLLLTAVADFRQAGSGATNNGGATWTTGIIEAGLFRSDPVLDSAAGNFYYNSLSVPSSTFECDVFRSFDGGKLDIGPLFRDGFESGDVSAWPIIVP